MNGYLTTAETAHRLGVTASRVRQMVLEGVLIGEKFGRDLFIPEFEVERVEQMERKPGRPAKEKE